MSFTLSGRSKQIYVAKGDNGGVTFKTRKIALIFNRICKILQVRSLIVKILCRALNEHIGTM